MKVVRRFWALDGSDKMFLAGCLATVVLVRLCLTLFSFNKMRTWLPAMRAEKIPAPAELKRVAWGIRNTARLVPGASCLTQALSGQIMLARRGKTSQVRLGVARDEKGRFIAHAWLVSEGKVVLGGAEANIQRFTPLTDLDWKRR